MAKKILSNEKKQKVEQLRKQIFEMKLEKSVSGSYNQAKANLLKKEIAKLIAE
jgi:ribosomal protein L29